MRTVLLLLFLFFISIAVPAQSARRAVDFQAQSLSGSTVDLASLRGKVVLVTFWSTRCPICNAEIPKLNRLAALYNSKDVVFLAPTADNAAKVNSYIRSSPFNFQIIPDSFGLMLKYAPPEPDGTIRMGYPAYFLIDQQGDVRYQAMGWDHIGTIGSSIDKLLQRRRAE